MEINATRQPGDLDPVFNGGKVDLSHLGLDPVFMNQVRPTPDGGVLVTAHGLRDGRFISKFTRQGQLDPDFREQGYFAVSPQQQLVVAADGGFYLVDQLSATEIFVEKFHANGQPDERYAERGRAIIDFAAVGVESLWGPAKLTAVPELGGSVLSVLDGGVLYVISSGYWGGWDGYRPVLTRLNRDGSLDRSFGKEGFVLFDRPGDKFSVPVTAQIQTVDGQPAALLLFIREVMPSMGWEPGYYFHLYRISGAGTFDEAFGDQGTITVHQDDKLEVDFFVDEQQTLKTYHQFSFDRLEVHGWTVDGQRDERFETLSIIMPPGMNIGLGLKSHGAGDTYRLVHFGSRYGETSEKRNVYRYLANGRADPAFGVEGAVALDVRYTGWLMNVELQVVPGKHDLYFTNVDDVFRLKGA